ncbi:MAG: TonB-dependent receptor [Bacteroidota bacterium]|nr:TonB-dependent receptor [Bacteroidota bacterium]
MLSLSIYAQTEKKSGTASVKGKITDKKTGDPLIGATINIVGTYNSAPTDIEGNYELKNIKQGDYTLKISYLGYSDKLYNGIKFKQGEEKILDITMVEAENNLGEVVIEGEKNLIDLESGKSNFKIVAEDIKEMNVRDVQQLVALQPGVNQTPDGIQIRGGRVYETAYLVDGVNAQDPLAGTGFGVGVSSGSIQDVSVITGGAGAEFGDAVSGVVSTKIKEGVGNKWKGGGNWITDNQNRLYTPTPSMGWNTDIVNFNVGGPIIKDKLTLFTSMDMNLTDDYTSIPNGDPLVSKSHRYRANQLKSSLLDDPNKEGAPISKTWAPRQDNKWANTVKVAYNIGKGMKLTLTNQHSLSINQNTRSLMVLGFDQVMVPGFQYNFSLNMDNATTYTHRTNLTVANFKYLFKKGWAYDIAFGRMFTNLRADANGRPFRSNTIDRVYDPASIVTTPVTVFNPNDSIQYVNPGPGLVNNNGISRTWHDHWVEEYNINQKFTRVSANNKNFLTFGWQHKEQNMQWVDVTSPWVGAPIRINDSLSTPSISVGSSSDIWKVQPANGGFFISDEIRYKGIIASFGLRLDYWSYGKYVDDAVNDSKAPIDETIRNIYKNQNLAIGDRSFQARLLPSVNVSFPVTDNNVLFFNYGQSKRLPHPLFINEALNPVYQNNSFLGNVGNPALRPEITVSYEIGIKSQITRNAAITFSAFYNDKFDYIVRRTQVLPDRTGQFVERQISINQDYARIRGAEIVYNQRIDKAFRTTLSLTYQIATGKSNTAAESSLKIQQQGFVNANKEQYLIWDTPIDSKFTLIFTPDSLFKVRNISLKGFRFFLSAVFKSNNQRYTPQVNTGTTDFGRPIYQDHPTLRNTELSNAMFWTDIKISKDLKVYKTAAISITLEVKNVFNNMNSILVNPVTGRAYQNGDQLPIDSRDPQYNNPQDNGTPPFNPARYKEPRQFLLGLAMQF